MSLLAGGVSGESDAGATSSTPSIALETRGITKAFGHVQALRGIDLVCRHGEILGLVGDNGAGKSTILRVLSGALQPDRGQILIDGRSHTIRDPAAARSLGIETVYQSLALSPVMSAAENLFLGREILRKGLLGRLGFVDLKDMERQAAARFADLGVPLPSVSIPVSALSGGQRQTVAVARAATFSGQIVLLDEPTAALAVEAARKVLRLIQAISGRGIAVVLVSHDLPRLFDVADRIVVLRLGSVVGSVTPASSSMNEVVAMMTGASGQTGSREGPDAAGARPATIDGEPTP